MTGLNSIFKPATRWAEKNRFSLIKILIIIGVLIAAVFVVPGAAFGSRKYLAVIVLVIGGISLLVLLRWPVLGLFITFIGGFFVSYSGPAGLNVAVLGSAMFMGIWILDMLVVKKEIRFVKSRTLLPLLVFILISIISFGIGQISWFALAQQAPIDAQIGGLAIFIISVGIFLAVAHLINDLRWLEWLTWFFLFLGALYIGGRLLGVPVDRFFQGGVISGSMFWTWMVVLAFGQALFNNHLKPFQRAALFGLVILTSYVALVINFDWKSGWVPPLVGIAVIIGLRYWRIARIVAPFILIPAIFYLAKDTIATDQYSWGTRLDAWFIVIEIAKVNPILGLGFANYYWYTPLFPIRGYAVSFNSHSQYIDLFAQVGLLGLACFLWFFGEVAWLGWQLLERVPDGFAKAYVYSALGGIVGTLVAAFLVDWVLPFVYNIGLNGFRASVLAWIFMGGLVSLEQMVRSQSGFQIAKE